MGRYVPFCKKCYKPMDDTITYECSDEVKPEIAISNNTLQCRHCFYVGVYNEEDFFNMDAIKERPH